ncbi:MAG: choice-of-anchor D domain-containing protein, partial [Proteobacteria bacterium]|nr:choice-of-anchor D domain-containing protein [Pseudomonadota bacterium]
MTIGLGAGTFAASGIKTGTVSIGFETDGTATSGIASGSLASQTVLLTGTVYSLATGSLNSASLTLPSVRIGGTFASGSVSVSNVTTNDGFSEKLNVLLGLSTGSASIVSGTLSLLGAGSSNTTGLKVTLNDTSAVGTKTGTVAVQYASDGNGTSGFSALDTGTQTLSVSGNVYRLASFSIDPMALNLGTIRAGTNTLSAGSVVITNTAATDGFSDLLGVQASPASGFSLTGGSVTLAAGAGSNLNLGYIGDTSLAGFKSGTLTLALTSVGQSGTGLSDVALGTQTVNVNATVFRTAVGALVSSGTTLVGGGTLNLGNIRIGQAFGTAGLDVRNVVASGSYSESLNAVISGTAGLSSGAGSASLVIAGGTSTNALTLGLGAVSYSSVGVKSGTVTVAYQTDGTGTSGLSAISAGSQTVQLTGNVYRLATGTLAAGSVNL